MHRTTPGQAVCSCRYVLALWGGLASLSLLYAPGDLPPDGCTEAEDRRP
ncbi:hypothetical protein ABZ154_32655 [Streptomyces sp. NPDC006261]